MFLIDQTRSRDAGEISGIEDCMSVIKTLMSNQRCSDDFASESVMLDISKRETSSVLIIEETGKISKANTSCALLG